MALAALTPEAADSTASDRHEVWIAPSATFPSPQLLLS